MKLYFIRHAQSTNNADWLNTGSTQWRDPDPTLTEIGHEQKRYLAKFLNNKGSNEKPLGRDTHNLGGFGITHLYSSLMIRAIETGLAVSEELGVPLQTWRDVHETGGIVSGDGETKPYEGLPGKPRSYFEKHYPMLKLADDFGEDGWWNRPFEEHEERMERAQNVISEIQARHGETEDQVAIVTHGAFYNLMMKVLLGIEDQQLWLALANTGVTRWDFRKDSREPTEWVRILDYSNRVDFLPANLITP